MNDLLELIHEYRQLRSAADPGDEEQARVVGLGRLLGSGVPWGRDFKDRSTRHAATFPVRFTVPGGFARGEIRTLSGAGIVIATRTPPAKGTRVLIRLDDQQGTSYVFPAQVAFRRGGRWGAFGAIFDGEPERVSTDESLSMWVAPGMRFGRRDTPLVA